MRSLFHIPLLTSVVGVILFASCGSHDNVDALELDSIAPITVDCLLQRPDTLVGNVVIVEGMCKRMGREDNCVYLIGDNQNFIIRCDATPAMGANFPDKTIGRRIYVKGIVQELRVDELFLHNIEREFAARARSMGLISQAEDALVSDHNNHCGNCEVENNINSERDSLFQAYLDLQNQRVDSMKRCGKSYYPVYYIEAVDYRIK